MARSINMDYKQLAICWQEVLVRAYRKGRTPLVTMDVEKDLREQFPEVYFRYPIKNREDDTLIRAINQIGLNASAVSGYGKDRYEMRKIARIILQRRRNKKREYEYTPDIDLLTGDRTLIAGLIGWNSRDFLKHIAKAKDTHGFFPTTASAFPSTKSR